MVCVSITTGLALIGGGIYLTWWNEANLVCSAGAFDKAKAETKALETCAIDKDLFDSFVHLTCPVEASLETFESSTGITAVGAYKMTLQTEQWGYQKSTDSQKTGNQRCETNNGNRVCKDETETCYCLKTVWTTTPVTQGTSSFKYCNKCPASQYTLPPANPVWGTTPTSQLGTVTKYADRVPLGDGSIQIDGSDISLINNQQLMTAPTAPTDIVSTNDFSLVGTEHCGESGTNLMCYKSLTKRVTTANSTVITDTVIGDLRMIVKTYGSTTLTALGTQKSNSDGTASIKSASFGETKVPPCKARDIFYAGDGTKASVDIYQDFNDDLKTLTTILRVVSFVIIFIGFYLMFSPIQEGADMIPCVGDCLAAVVGFVLYIICGLLTFAVWFTVFAIAWVFYRPVLGAVFLAVAGLFTALAFYVYKRQVSNRSNERSIDYPEAAVIHDRDGYDYGEDKKGFDP